MKRVFVVLALVSVFVIAANAEAQEGGCTPDYIAEQVSQITATHQAALAEAGDTESALASVGALQEALAALQEECAAKGSGTLGGLLDISPGSGTLKDPFAFGRPAATGERFTLQITGVIRPADRMVYRENMFNDKAGPGEEYIVIQVKMECGEDASGRCEANYLNFELVGDQGTIYEVPWIVYDGKFDISLFAGGTGEGVLPFLISQSDTNLCLMYRPNIYQDDFVVYAAEPSLENGIEVVSSDSINVRGGPGTNFSVVGSLVANTPTIAFGRNPDSTWLQISTGWVFADLLTIDGDAQVLPVTWQP
ncbi:MAG: SH3 domain-containing protein [Anaerolineae bacterium]|nr:SH3 domain-containing protein [Anaerolineae bacterium]